MLAGWDVAAAFVVGSVWSFIVVLDAEATRQVATREDDSRTAVDLIMVIASVVSLVGVVIGLAHARDHHGVLSSVLTGVAVFTVFLSWFTVHTLFVLRYAHLYYNEPVGGIEFSKTRRSPDYLDFVYVAFTIGMTFQVSDTADHQTHHPASRDSPLAAVVPVRRPDRRSRHQRGRQPDQVTAPRQRRGFESNRRGEQLFRAEHVGGVGS